MQGWVNIHKSIHIIQHINRSKGKNHVIISIDAEKAFDKIYHPFVIKALKKLGIEGMFLSIINAIYNKTYIKHYTKWSTPQTNLAKVGNETGCPFLPLPFSIVVE
jgi:hypothetical protein